MNRLQTLLVATDLSAPSRHAALRAALLAKESKSRLELLHVLESTALGELQRVFEKDGAAMQERIRSQARDGLLQLAADIGELRGVSAGSHVAEGSVLNTCLEQADAFDASLIIVGVRGTSFMRHWLLGATAERLLRKTQRPILVVKQPPHEMYRSVLVPIDFSSWSLDAIRMAQAVAPQAKLILLHVYEIPFEGKLRYASVEEGVVRSYRESARKRALDQLHQTASDAGLVVADWHPIAVHGDAALRILEHEEVQGADLIVLGKHGAGMIEELLLGSVTKHVLAHSRSDVLVATRQS